MKYSFSTILLVSLCCLDGNITARTYSPSAPTAFEKIKKAVGLASEAKKSKPHNTPNVEVAQTKETPQPKALEKTPEGAQEQKLAVVAALQKEGVAVKSLKDVIDSATDRNDKTKFGIGALVKSFREQAANNNNPQKHLFAQDLVIGEKLLQIQGNNLTEATAIAKQLSPETQNLLRESLERRYSVFSRLGALKDFVNTRD